VGKGSYHFDGFDDKSAELEVLERQSSAAPELDRLIWKNAGLKDGMRVLDVGCGPGYTSFQIAKLVKNGSVTGIDISSELISEARKIRKKLRTGNISFVRGNAHSLRFPDSSFDFVHARFLFQHLSSPGAVLRGISRILKPGGRICIIDIDDRCLKLHPEPPALQPLLKRSAAIQKKTGGDRHVGGKLGGMLYDAGFLQVATSIHLLSSREIGLRKLLDITVGFREGLFPAREKSRAESMIGGICRLSERSGANGWCGIFTASGIKG